MQILNLVNFEKSEIKYTLSRFPDGEVQISLGDFSHKDKICVKCRITNAEELFIVTQVLDILDRHDVYYDVNIFYLMGMRMDRVMDFNKPFSLKIVANIIKSCGAKDIYVLEPHSERVHIELGSKPIYNPIDMIRKVAFGEDSRYSTKVIVFPNASAKERYNTGSIDNTVVCFNNDYNLKNDKISISIKLENENDTYYLKRYNEEIMRLQLTTCAKDKKYEYSCC